MSEGRGRWPTRRLLALDWLVLESGRERFLERLFATLCSKLLEDGLPIGRSTLHLRTLHPQFFGARLVWRPGMEEAEIGFFGHHTISERRFLDSPVRALYEGAEAIHQRLDLEAPAPREYPVYAELRAEGMTDYVAMPMTFTDGSRHACTWATKRPGGFRPADLAALGELLPALAMVTEIRLSRRIARNLLDAYVGRHAGARILAGEIRRGSGATVRAAIWQSDLRDFTTIVESLPRDAVIECLNGFFECMGAPVEAQGGEILKFVGDGMLAIFPLEAEAACHRALRAAVEARRGLARLNAERRGRGQEPLRFALALHVGDVMYGNIGTPTRLDFTVIGPAVNVAARLQQLAKELDRDVVLSGPFAAMCACDAEFLEPLGRFPLRGVPEPVEVLALVDRSRS
jgi:adenylate cyclase